MDDETDIKCTRSGVRVYDDGECAYSWWLFDNEQIAAELAQHSDREDLAFALTGAHGFYGGPGRAFGDDPCARVGRFHTLVTHRTGLDV